MRAVGGDCGAGIGSGDSGTCGEVSVLGGVARAVGGYAAAGIGSGGFGSCGNVAIGDGVIYVVAMPGEDEAPIGASTGGTCGKVSVGVELVDETDGEGTRFLSHKYPDYLLGAERDVVERYWSWVVENDGFDDSGEHEESFLLNVAPGSVQPPAGDLLRVSFFESSAAGVRLGLACGIPGYRFFKPENTDWTRLCNGIAVIEVADDLGDLADGNADAHAVRVTVDENGGASVELRYSDYGISAPSGAGFFRPSIRPVSP